MSLLASTLTLTWCLGAASLNKPKGERQKKRKGACFCSSFFFFFPVREFLSLLHVPHLITSLCTALVHVYMCVCVLYSYMIVGLQLLPTESSGSTKREVYYKGEGTTLVLTKGKKRENDTRSCIAGGMHTQTSLVAFCDFVLLFFFGFFFVFFFFFLSVFSEVNVCSMLMTPAVCIIM